MSVCATLAGVATLVAGSGFTLSWTHSVERTEWRERWTETADGLRLVEARVRGSGAGMDPGDGARLEGGWWVWAPALPAVASLALAASGETGDGWTLCDDPRDDPRGGAGDAANGGAGCRELGAAAGEPTLVAPCSPDDA